MRWTFGNLNSKEVLSICFLNITGQCLRMVGKHPYWAEIAIMNLVCKEGTNDPRVSAPVNSVNPPNHLELIIHER